MEKTIVLNVEYTMKPGGAEGFVREVTQSGLLQDIRSHEGCLKYDYYRACQGENLLLVEWWTDQAALDKHLAQPCMAVLQEIKNKYAAGVAVEKYPVK